MNRNPSTPRFSGLDRSETNLHFKMWSALLFLILVTLYIAVCEEEKGSDNSSNTTPEKELSVFEKNYIVIPKWMLKL